MKNNTVDLFKIKQDKATSLLGEINNLTKKGLELGVDIPENVQSKIDNVNKLVSSGSQLKVALIGGFSEGKTSIVSGWIEDFDKSSMKISQQESSDEVNIYKVNDEIELIDTPGLFGFKEKYNDRTGKIEKYKEITKKYISEAHLVLYVMDSANPIKESHKEDLLWLFRELALLPRTVFVLSRFDEVADVEDEWNYRETLKTKKENVLTRLHQQIDLSDDEEKTIQVVGVAANPYGNGMEYWLQHLEEYKNLSKIESLQKATREKIDSNDGYFSLVYEMQKSAIIDILGTLDNVEKLSERTKNSIKEFTETYNSLSEELNSIARKINTCQGNLVDFLIGYFKDLLLKANGCGMETMKAYIDTEIGPEGEIMYAAIQSEFARQTKNIENQLNKLQIDFNTNTNHFDSIMESIGKDGLNYIAKSGVVNAKNILFVRDGIESLAKVFGTDISKFLKFKPWGATNLAKGLNNVLQGIGVFLEIWEIKKRKEAEEKFIHAKEELVKNLDDTRKELLNTVQNDDFVNEFFPNYNYIKEQFEVKKQEISRFEHTREDIDNWSNDVKLISGKFRKLA